MKRKFIAFTLLLAGLTVAAQSQVSYKVTVTVAAGTYSQNLEIGINGDGAGPADDNTYGVDTNPLLGIFQESLAPPAPPAPYDFDARLTTNPGRTTSFPAGLGGGVYKQIVPFSGVAQVDTFKINATGDAWDNGATISWPANLCSYGTSWIIKPATGTAFAPVDMIANTSLVIPAFAGVNNIYIIKVGGFAPSPGPTFAGSPNPLAFGSRNVNSSTDLVLTISNTGTVNPLVVSAVDTTLGGQAFFWVGTAPNPAGFTIAANGSVNYTVRFTPTAGAGYSEQIEFAHNASGSPSPINLTGTGQSQGGDLVFASSTVTRNDLTTGYVDSLLLASHVGTATKSLQLRIINTYSPTSLTRLTGVSRGERLADPSKWIFQYEIGHGPVASDLSSIDTIRLVILGTNDSLTAGSATQSLVKFTYSVVDIGTDTAYSSMTLANVVSSTWKGESSQVVAGPSQTVVILDRGVGLNGDTNGDGFVDLLDLLQVIDHILGRITLQSREFARSDVAPWPTGDNVLDARDVALIQQIILTGEYPDGAPIPFTGSGRRTMSKTGVARLVFDVNNESVAVSIESNEIVKGLQFDIAGAVSTGSAISEMNTVLGSQNGNSFRSVMFQNSGSEFAVGAHAVATLPIRQLSELNVRNVVVANARNEKVAVNVVLRKSGADVPEAFALLANFPNPFNPSTTISFAVPTASDVRVTVIDLLGREIRTLVASSMNAGTHSVAWDGLDNSGAAVSSGMYMYRMQAGDFTATRTMTLNK